MSNLNFLLCLDVSEDFLIFLGSFGSIWIRFINQSLSSQAPGEISAAQCRGVVRRDELGSCSMSPLKQEVTFLYLFN